MRAVILSLGLALLLCASSDAQFCDPPGEFVGTTQYPIQSLGSSVNRISVDQSGGISVVWTNYIVDGPRCVYYNFRNEEGQWSYQTGSRVTEENGSAYPSISLFPDERVAIAYHILSPEYYVAMATNFWRGSGVFEHNDVPDQLPGGNRCLWPHVAVSANGDLHVLMRENRESDYEGFLAYTRSENGGYDWTDPEVVDLETGYDGRITASQDGKVAIVYACPTDPDSHHVFRNDVCYFLSQDGRDWDFSEPTFITDYENDDLDIYCLQGIDGAFDFDGFLNVIWITGNIVDDEFIDDAVGLWHYSERTGEINLASEMTDPDVTCDADGFQIDMPTMSIDSTGAVEIIYTGYVDTDVSSEGDCVGDLYMVYGRNYGGIWFGPYNITATHTPGCLPGECQSESQPSTAEVMADSVYLTYNMRLFIQETYPPDTVYYMPVAVPYWVGTHEDESIPAAFELLGNHPNPFNAATNIEFELVEKSEVELSVYDIGGARVVTLADGEMQAGRHSVGWDAGDAASGVYYYRLKAGGQEETRKMTLLK